jgi:hypothetical protein
MNKLWYFVILGEILCCYLVVAGFHNIDLAYNFKGLATTDCNGFKCQSLDELYSSGTNMTFAAFLINFALFAALLGKEIIEPRVSSTINT